MVMSVVLPQPVAAYIAEKVEPNGSGGRPHFLAQVGKERDPTDVLLDIAELTWIKQKSLSKVARKFSTSYHTIYRVLDDLQPYKEELISLIETSPRRKTFWNRQLNASDYDTVQAFIKYAEREELKAYKNRMNMAEHVWKALGYKDPSNWHIDDVVAWIKTQPDGSQSGYVDAVRAVAPQFKTTTSPDYLPVSRYRAKIKKRKKPLFGQDIILVHEAIDAKLTPYHKDVFDFHITGGFREGANHPEAGITGISWDRFKKGFSKVDDYESKVRSTGMWWRNCPVDLFFHDLPQRLRQRWEAEGKPTTAKLVKEGYPELLQIYKDIRKACKEYWQGTVEPALLKEMSTLRPHDADKIHCNLCWEAGISLEVVAGQDLGNQEGLGLVGRGWLSTDTIKKYYLSLTQRSPKYQEMLAQVAEYASQFNGTH
jgi:hypothetical protein